MSISNALDPLNATDIKRLFFEKINVTQVVLNSHVEMYRCRCGQIKTQSVEDETNDKLVEHVLSDHMEWLSGPASFVNDSEKLSVENGSCPSTQSTKRESYLTWNDYFMSVAFLSAMRSKDPSTQVGACIVNPEKKIVGIGYNGFPNGCDDDDLPWARQTSRGDILATKYPYVCHAEMNAILNKNSADVQGCTVSAHYVFDVINSSVVDLCGIIPMQRMRQIDHSERHSAYCLLLRQISQRLEIRSIANTIRYGKGHIHTTHVREASFIN